MKLPPIWLDKDQDLRVITDVTQSASHAHPMYAQQRPTTELVAWVFIAVVLFVLPVALALQVGHLM
jgi:hypothetical protein